MTTIDCGVCRLRPWQWGDEASLVRHANNRRVWLNLRDAFPHPYTTEDATVWIAVAVGQRPVTNFAIEVDGAAVGGIGLIVRADVERCAAEIGYWLGESCWGRGIMTAAVRAVTTYGFDRLALERIFAGVFEWNTASMRVLAKAGYGREAVLRRSAIKDGKVIDRVIYAAVRASDGLGYTASDGC